MSSHHQSREAFETKLWVNGTLVGLNPFVEEFLARTVIGAVSALKGVEDIKALELDVENDSARIKVNGTEITITPFPNDVIVKTFIGLLSTLKGVDKIDGFKVVVRVL